MKYITILLCILLTACGKNASEYSVSTDTNEVIIINACLQREIFNECMKVLPAGPTATKYNDWDEVVSECRVTSRHLSKRARKFVPAECEG